MRTPSRKVSTMNLSTSQMLDDIRLTLDTLELSIDSPVRVGTLDRPTPNPFDLPDTPLSRLTQLVIELLIRDFKSRDHVFTYLLRKHRTPGGPISVPNQVTTALWHMADDGAPAYQDVAEQQFLQSVLDQCVDRLEVVQVGSKNPVYHLVVKNNNPLVDPYYMRLGSMLSVVIRELVKSGALDNVDLGNYKE